VRQRYSGLARGFGTQRPAQRPGARRAHRRCVDAADIDFMQKPLPNAFRDLASALAVADAACGALPDSLFSPFRRNSNTLNERWIGATMDNIAALREKTAAGPSWYEWPTASSAKRPPDWWFLTRPPLLGHHDRQQQTQREPTPPSWTRRKHATCGMQSCGTRRCSSARPSTPPPRLRVSQ